MIHELKIKPQYFEAIRNGDKNFEIRKNDRDYQVGDYIALNELNDSRDGYTGRSMLCEITFVCCDERLCKEGFATLSISVCQVQSGYRNPTIELISNPR